MKEEALFPAHMDLSPLWMLNSSCALKNACVKIRQIFPKQIKSSAFTQQQQKKANQNSSMHMHSNGRLLRLELTLLLCPDQCTIA